jgi:hypothetical protein
MKREDDQELWDLLGHAAEPKVSPFFARNVVRRIRQDGDSKGAWLRPRRLIPALGFATVLIAAGLLRWQAAVGPLHQPALDTLATVDTIDYDLVNDVEELLASDENNSLDENILL